MRLRNSRPKSLRARRWQTRRLLRKRANSTRLCAAGCARHIATASERGSGLARVPFAYPKRQADLPVRPARFAARPGDRDANRPALKHGAVQLLHRRIIGNLYKTESARTTGFTIDHHDRLRHLANGRELVLKIFLVCYRGDCPRTVSLPFCPPGSAAWSRGTMSIGRDWIGTAAAGPEMLRPAQQIAIPYQTEVKDRDNAELRSHMQRRANRNTIVTDVRILSSAYSTVKGRARRGR